jgi:MFS family permease
MYWSPRDFDDVFSGITGLAVLSGPLLVGAIVHGLAWQWIFWINLPGG